MDYVNGVYALRLFDALVLTLIVSVFVIPAVVMAINYKLRQVGAPTCCTTCVYYIVPMPVFAFVVAVAYGLFL